MYLNLNIVGAILILLALAHSIFPRYFNWSKELPALSLVNQQLMYIHTFFIALVLLLMGLLCVTSATEVITTHLGHKLLLGLGIFWAIRLIIQFFGYSPQIWKGKRLETSIHILFVLLWCYFSVSFFYAYFNTATGKL
jgi:membrane glycosyltransferase